MKRVDLKQRYKKEISKEMDYIFSTKTTMYLYIDCDGQLIESRYYGDQLSKFPSGKIWAFWTSNQTKADMIRDELYSEVLEDVASDMGYYIDYEQDIRICSHMGDDWQFTKDGVTFKESVDGKVIARSKGELKEYREKEQYWPSVVFLDDHGYVEYFSLD